MQIRHIIHPTDFSDIANNALKAAAFLAKTYDAQLHIVHMYDEPYAYSHHVGTLPALLDTELNDQLQQEFSNKMRELAQQDFMKDVDGNVRLITNRPVWRFYEALEEDDIQADLVVMGTHGNTGLLHGGIIGTNAERTIRYSPIPVLSIPPETSIDKVEEVLYVTDFSDDLSECSKTLVPIIEFFNAHLLVATVATPSEFFTTEYCLTKFKEFEQRHPNLKTHYELINAYSMDQGVKYLADLYDIDIVAMFTEGRSGVMQIFKRSSVTEHLSANIPRPLLALKPGDQD